MNYNYTLNLSKYIATYVDVYHYAISYTHRKFSNFGTTQGERGEVKRGRERQNVEIHLAGEDTRHECQQTTIHTRASLLFASELLLEKTVRAVKRRRFIPIRLGSSN